MAIRRNEELQRGLKTVAAMAGAKVSAAAALGAALGNALGGKLKQPAAPQDTGGITFSEGSLKGLQVVEKKVKNSEGVFETKKEYRATLADGTVVIYEKQPERGEKEVKPQIIKNKDGSYDFVGINNAIINDTPKDDMYNLMGCSFTHVNLIDNKDDHDTVNFTDVKDQNGEVVKNHSVHVQYDGGDTISTSTSRDGAYHVNDGTYTNYTYNESKDDKEV